MIRQQRRWSSRVTIAAFTCAAAIGLVALAVVMTRPGETAPTREANAVTEAGLASAGRSVPQLDHTLDLRTGVTTPLPEEIIVSVAEFGRSELTKYAASPDGSTSPTWGSAMTRTRRSSSIGSTAAASVS
jgi:hypothetical protein